MGLLNWSPRPELNGVADPLIPAMDGASARGFPALVRGVMAEVARHASDQGGALKTAGLANAFTVSTASGVSALRNGLRFIVRPDRTNTDAPTLNVDGTGPKPWLDASGDVIVAQGVVPDHIMAVTYDADLDAWRSDGTLAIRNEGLAAMPPATLKGNGGPEASAPADLTAEEAREVIGLDHVANKSEEEMVAAGPISDAFTQVADALATKATPANIADAISPISQALEAKASTHYVDRQIEIVGQSVTDLADDVEDVKEQVTAIASGQSSGAVIAKSWAALSAVPPNAAGSRAEVIGTATTTHPDPVAAGNPAVPDPGTYRGSLSPLGWERIGPTTASAAADQVGESITTSPLARAPLLQLAFRDPDTKRLTVLSPADSAAYLQETAVPTVYPQEVTDIVVTNQSSVILAEDDLRRGDISIQIAEGVGDLGLNFVGNDPVFGSGGTIVQKGSQYILHPSPGRKSVRAVLRGATSAHLSIRVWRTVDAAPPSLVAEDIFSQWTGTVDPRYKDVIRQEVIYLSGHGIYQKLAGWWLPGSSKENFRVNLAKPGGPRLTYHEGANNNGITFVPYTSIKGNGVDAYADTMRLPSENGVSLTDHFMAAKSVGGLTDSSGYLMGASGSLFMNPNRGAGLYGFRSGPGTDTNAADLKALDLWACMSRVNDANNYKAFIDESVVLTPARVLGALPGQTMKLFCGAGGSPASQFTAIPLAGAAFGASLSDLNTARFVQSNKRIAAVCAQIVGA